MASTGKRSAQDLTGVDGDIVALEGNGWVVVRTTDGSETLRVQQRYLEKRSKDQGEVMISSDGLRVHTTHSAVSAAQPGLHGNGLMTSLPVQGQQPFLGSGDSSRPYLKADMGASTPVLSSVHEQGVACNNQWA